MCNGMSVFAIANFGEHGNLEACKKCVRPNGLVVSSIGCKQDPAEGDFRKERNHHS